MARYTWLIVAAPSGSNKYQRMHLPRVGGKSKQNKSFSIELESNAKTLRSLEEFCNFGFENKLIAEVTDIHLTLFE